MFRELACLRLQALGLSLVPSELSTFPCPPALFTCWQIGISSLGLRVSWSVPSISWSLSINGTRVLPSYEEWLERFGEPSVGSFSLAVQTHDSDTSESSWARKGVGPMFSNVCITYTIPQLPALQLPQAGFKYQSLKKLNSFALLLKPPLGLLRSGEAVLYCFMQWKSRTQAKDH